MTHFSLLCPAIPGHLNPMTTLGHAIRAAGIDILLVDQAAFGGETLVEHLKLPHISSRSDRTSCGNGKARSRH